jgi:hypothetical protein
MDGGGYSLVPIAESGERFAGFAPYVASITDAGSVAFQAVLRSGGDGVFSVAVDGSLSTLVDSASGSFAEVVSHPDVGADGSASFYARQGSSRTVVLVRKGQAFRLHDAAGPLGPTIDHAGTVAFRVELPSGVAGILIGNESATRTVADTSAGRFSAFDGLPVINRGGSVAFRASVRAGGEGIYRDDDGSLVTVAETGGQFATLGEFPVIDDAGIVAFCATTPDGRPGAYALADGGVETLIDGGDVFASLRGVLRTNTGRVVFYATPRDGQLGVFSGPDPERDCLLRLGGPLFGSTVVDFALNPVSINEAGQIAIRVSLADERQLILRADPLTA